MNAPAQTGQQLTDRQIHILDLVSQGWTYLEVAQALGTTVCSVTSHLKRSYALLGAKSASHAVRICLESGVFGPDRAYRTQEDVEAILGELKRVYRALAVANGEHHEQRGRVLPHAFGEYLLQLRDVA